ncbi:MAG: LysR family transcriptional regulator [Labilithrix sp.]|nr:LysR family transcriptional regulator [Labilithrix sp.]
MRTLPSLSALRAFEAAARHQSFKRAAAELHVTPTAVSHQIRLLEESTGVRLFVRETRRVVLTPAAEVLFPILRDSFDAIAQAVAVVARPAQQGVVTLSATTAFTAKWLVPRLAKMRIAHPSIALRLEASDDVIDLKAGAVDLAIRYGHGPYPRLDAMPLIVDRFAPVASPRLRVRTFSDLERHTRIEFDWHKADRSNPTWARWSRARKRVHRRAAPALRFSDESHAIQAAIAGQGVALLSLTLVAEELRTKLLEVPFGPAMSGPTYHLVHTRREALSPAARTVKEWILAEARAARAEVDQLAISKVSVTGAKTVRRRS